MVYFDGLNRFYLANEAAHFRSCFDLPPNVFDDYNLYALERAHVAMHALELQLADASEQLRAMQEQIAQLEAERAQAEEQRIKLRQWVGRLSQELALRSRQRES
jgi:septal ring factor EnvC (AmiA/AmiB activator)